MDRRVNIFVILRLVVGAVFLVSGFEKLMGPYQNFLYVIEGYDIFPMGQAEWIARILPWMEFLTGIFLVTGLWLTQSLGSALVLFGLFMAVVAQALIRGLDLSDCGCFGELLSFPLPVVFLMDSIFLVVTAMLLQKKKMTGSFSLDRYFEKF